LSQQKITPLKENFSDWYHDVIMQAQLADYSPVKGCMVIRPNGYHIWEKIQAALDQKIKAMGVQNAYFPLFIPESFLKKEAQHVEGFSPECAMVTHAGGKLLEEPLVVRPTSETIINSMFSRWIQSYRDLPLMINQWANVVRWEMRTRLFLRTTEFLWQEGHTCHEDKDSALFFAKQMLKVYQNLAKDLLAMPVIMGQKSESERFAGAVKTYTIEAMMQDGKALQAGTSHYLGTNFAAAFETQFQDKTGKLALVHQTSWGVSTRLIGGLIMTHSDDLGLVLPPRVARFAVILLPIFQEKNKAEVLPWCDKIGELLSKAGIDFTVDADASCSLGEKRHRAERIGIPLRLEFGLREIQAEQLLLVRRDTLEKTLVSLSGLIEQVQEQLLVMQSALYEKALLRRQQNTHVLLDIKDMSESGFFEASWCQSLDCEQKMKEQTKATIRCLKMDDDFEVVSSDQPCVVCGQHKENLRVVIARSY
jgi:prolyl-tRNA synthetase